MILVDRNKFPKGPMASLAEEYSQDKRPEKFELRLGVYRDAEGNSPILKSVKLAEKTLVEKELTKEYMTPAGNRPFCSLVEKLILGDDHPIFRNNRIRSIQTPGAGSGLRIIGEIITTSTPNSRLWISRPGWSHYKDVYGFIDIEMKEFSYYDNSANTLLFDRMLMDLQEMKEGDLILLQACCHNPTGADLSKEQWNTLCELIIKKRAIPVIDLAYHGFGENLEEDAYSARLFAEKCPLSFLLYTASKNFSLYNDRVGMTSVLCNDSSIDLDIFMGILITIAKNLYFMPPNHGAAIVAEILKNNSLRELWESELSEYRDNIKALRNQLANQLQALPGSYDYSYLKEQKGMFSILPLTQDVISRMREDFAIYLVASGRINIAGLSPEKIPTFVNALTKIHYISNQHK